MMVTVGDVRLFVDVDGMQWVPDGPSMRRRPTVVFLNGGPGVDSSGSKSGYSWLSDVAQVVYSDHRGNGRSDEGDRSKWTLAQWGDDVRALCDALGIEHPIVIGASFGGFVAMSYATRHPGHAAALGLLVTAARDAPAEDVIEAFRRLGGDEVAEVVREDLVAPTIDTSDAFIRHALPYYSQRPDAVALMAESIARAIRKPEVEIHFNAGELPTMDFREALSSVTCPTLVVSGELDPILPPSCWQETVDALNPSVVEAHLVPGAGHTLALDAPETVQRIVTEFVQRHGGPLDGATSTT